MKKKENITLLIAILGAITGLISFYFVIQEKIQYRPRIEIDLVGVYDISGDSIEPWIVIVAEFRNLGNSKVTIDNLPYLNVKSLKHNIESNYQLNTNKLNELIYVELSELEIKTVTYRCYQFEMDIMEGKYPNFNKISEELFFEIYGKSTVGGYKASGKGLIILDKNSIDILKSQI